MPYCLPVICKAQVQSSSQFLKHEIWTWLPIDEVVHFVDYPLRTTERVLALQSYTNALEDYMYSSVMGSGQAHCCTLTVKAVQTKCYHHIYHHHSIKQIRQEIRCFL